MSITFLSPGPLTCNAIYCSFPPNNRIPPDVRRELVYYSCTTSCKLNAIADRGDLWNREMLHNINNSQHYKRSAQCFSATGHKQ